MYSFSDSDVTYETNEGTYLHAGYLLKENNIIFENIEELVVDEQSARENSRKVLSNMVEAVLDNDKLKASSLFNSYLSLNNVRREFMEGTEVEEEPKKGKKEFPFNKDDKDKDKKKGGFPFGKKKKKKKGNPFFDKKKGEFPFKKGKKVEVNIRTKAPKKKLKEWNNICENVSRYVVYKKFGPIKEQSELRQDDRGNVVALRIPVNKIRNEGKILSFNWKTLNTEVQVLRNKVKTETQQGPFCHAISDLKSANAVSDNEKMDHIIEAIVARWPNLIYLNQSELTDNIKEALSTVGQPDYDDEICSFLSEGILRKATETYNERVNRILKIAGVSLTSEDEVYEVFQNTVSKFYPKLDETTGLEMQVFVDLYNTLTEVHKIARAEGNTDLYRDTNDYLKDLYDVIQQKIEPNIELAEEVSTWLSTLIETNLDSQTWDVSNAPYNTVSGDHPQMEKNAKKGYTPASDFSGNWGDPAPVSDGKNYTGKDAEEMRSHSWGNISTDKDVWPSLDNPYVPKAGAWKMNEPNATDSGDSDWSRFQSKDTWPNLQNPYVPTGVTPYTYKAKTDNLVVDQ